MRKISMLFSSISIFLLLNFFTASASASMPEFVSGTLFDLLEDSDVVINWLVDKQAEFWGNTSNCTGCTSSGGNHNWKVHTVDGIIDLVFDDGTDHNGIYYKSVICDDCGLSAYDYIMSANQEFVDTLPGSVYDSSGRYFMPIIFRECRPNRPDYVEEFVNHSSGNHVSFSCIPLTTGYVVGAAYVSNECPYYYGSVTDIQVPYSGVYVPAFIGNLDNCRAVVSRSNPVTLSANGYMSLLTNTSNYEMIRFQPLSTGVSISADGYVGLWCTPTTMPDVYTPDTRIGPITGDVVVIGDNNETTVYNDCQFVDETNQTIYNPVTNTNVTYTDFNYDYNTYTYNFNTDTGDTYNINYGDEYITYTSVIDDTTTVTNYYYYISEPAPQPSPEPSGGDTTTIIDLLEDIWQKLVDIYNAVLGIDADVDVDLTNDYDVDLDLGTDVDMDFDVDITTEGEDGQNKFEKFINKFSWISDVHTIGQSFLTDITSDSANAYAYVASVGDGSSGEGVVLSAPVIYVDLGAAESNYGYDYGGRIAALDLSWYARYKPTVDMLISGFLWLLFLWGLFKQAPNIIAGVGIAENRSDDIAAGHKGGRRK